MPASMRFWQICALFVVGTVKLQAQNLPEEPSMVLLRKVSPQDQKHREAVRLYAQAMLREREDCFVEASKILQEAAKLEPTSLAIHKALAPLYLALDKMDDFAGACNKILELDPGDHETWFLYARQLKDQGKIKEARSALAHAAACPKLHDQPDLAVQVLYDLGGLCEEDKDYDKALSAFGQAVKILDHPVELMEAGPYTEEDIANKAAELCERMGKICVQTKRYDEAMDAFAIAQKKDPLRKTRLTYNLATVRLAQDQKEDALRYLDEYLKSQPPDLEGYETKISVLKDLDRKKEIVPMLRDYARRDAHNVSLKTLLARQLVKDGQTREAETLFQSLAKESPSLEVYNGLFNLYRVQNRMGQVLSLFDEAVAGAVEKPRPGKPVSDQSAAAQARAMVQTFRDDKELAKGLIREGQRKIQSRGTLEEKTLSFLATLAIYTRQLAEAENFYRSLLNGGRVAATEEAAIYEGLLQVLWAQRKYDEVVEICQQGLKQAQATNRIVFHHDLSRALALLGKSDEALAQADQAIALAADEKNRLYTRLNKVRVLRQAEKFDSAIAQCKELIKDYSQPDQLREVRYELSHLYSVQRDLVKSEEQLQLILKADPNDATASNDLGYLWADQGKNLEEAERLIRKAIDLDREEKKKPKNAMADPDDHAAYLDSLGWVLFRRGQLDQAIEKLGKASTLEDGAEDPVIWDHLGDVYFRLDDAEHAKQSWQKAVTLYETVKKRKLDDQYKDLKNKLKLLETEN